MKEFLKLFWRQCLILVLMALPFLAMVGLGLAWLHERGMFLYALIAMASCGVAAFLLGRPRPPIPGCLASNVPGAPIERKARAAVQAIANEAANAPPDNMQKFKALATHVVNTVAREINGKASFPWATFTVPELLAAVVDGSDRLRIAIQKRVPGSEQITVAQVLMLYRLYLEHGSLVKVGMYLYRFFRLIGNPLGALIQEFKGVLMDGAMRSVSSVALGTLTRIFVEELAEVAIKLYGGGYRNTPKIEIDRHAPDATPKIPIRVLFAGQVNAGKSSITNALLGSIKSPVSVLPTPGGAREFRVDPGAPFDLVVVDAAGLTTDDSPRTRKGFVDLCLTVDLIAWVSKTNQPARDIDVDVLREIRAHFAANPKLRPPPMILVTSHIDQIFPANEWSPPYDFAHGAREKEQNVRDAMNVIADTLEFDDSVTIVPMALRSGESFNLPGLWDAIGECANEAMLVALDREMKKGRFDPWLLFEQVANGAKYAAGKAVQPLVDKKSSVIGGAEPQ